MTFAKSTFVNLTLNMMSSPQMRLVPADMGALCLNLGNFAIYEWNDDGHKSVDLSRQKTLIIMEALHRSHTFNITSVH